MKHFGLRSLFLSATLMLALASVCLANNPYQSDTSPTPVSEIDRLVGKELSKHGIEAAKPASEEVFFRRVYLDVTGTLPPPQAWWKYRKIGQQFPQNDSQ